MNFTVKPAQSADLENTFLVIKKAFDRFVAPGYSKEGVTEFYNYASLQGLLERLSDDIILIAQTPGGKTIGMIEIRNLDHICLLFVDPDYQGNGAARLLVRAALEKCGTGHRMEVNASPYAVPVYERLGFIRQAPEQLTNGIRYVPMAKDL